MAKLNTYVDVDGTWYGPGFDVPDEVAAKITNPKVWAESPAPALETPAQAQLAAEVKEPPRGGPGSSAEAWRAFLEAKEYEVPAGASAKDMQAAWDARAED